ncbi:MAG TPA: ABC transporter substrate-binding protein [Aggregatilineaceae bacterium]|nr:ABC transporter substrate-binding protein [Aggregatilineaceae bacterium]
MKHKNLLVLVMLLVVMVATPLMSQGPKATAQEDTLTVLCTPQEDWCVAMTEAFEAETGIDTSYVRLSSGEALARIRATQDDPEFSVWWGGPADAFIAATEEGLLEPYEPELGSILEPEIARGEGGYWHGVYLGVMGFCSNVEFLDELGIEAPTSWDDLLAPELKGNIAMAHPATSGTAFTAFWTVVTLKADELETAEAGKGYDEEGAPTDAAIDAAFEYFSDLHQNILQYTRSGAAPGQMAGNGEIAVAIIFSHDCVKLQQEGFGEVLVNTFPEEGTGYEIGGMGLIKDAPEPEAAKMWIDWALTPEAQAVAATVNSLQLPTNPETPVSELSVKLDEVKLINYNFMAAGARRNDIAERFDADIAPQPTE